MVSSMVSVVGRLLSALVPFMGGQEPLLFVADDDGAELTMQVESSLLTGTSFSFLIGLLLRLPFAFR